MVPEERRTSGGLRQGFVTPLCWAASRMLVSDFIVIAFQSILHLAAQLVLLAGAGFEQQPWLACVVLHACLFVANLVEPYATVSSSRR